MLITLVGIFTFVVKITLSYTMDKKPILLQFGHKVQQIRKTRSLSQEQLAELAGVHRTYIGMIERAEKNITLCNIEKIALALKVDIKELL
jgi:DNA-binding XRE family transcriptional regulator